MREDHYDNLREKKYFSLEKARQLHLQVVPHNYFWLIWNRELPLSVIAGGLEGLWASPSNLLRNSGLWQLWPEQTGQWSGFFLLFSEILCSSHPTFDLNFRRCLISTGSPSLTRGSWGGSTQTVGATFDFWLNQPNIVFVLGKSISWDAQMSDIMMWLKIGW